MSVKDPRKKPSPAVVAAAPSAQAAQTTTPMSAASTSTGDDASASHEAAPELSAAARAVLEGVEPGLAPHVAAMEQEGRAGSVASRVVEEVIAEKPQLGAPFIAKLVRLLLGGPARSVQAAATCLPQLTRTAPAKVARHLELLRSGYDAASDTAKDGMVRIFVALCLASVAYQRRVIDVIERALRGAEAKQLVTWTELALPALKGEPHAQARAVVEERLADLPRPQAQRIADFLGVKLRK